MEPLLGQVILFSGNFAPRGWAFCDGQLLDIKSNEALFAILGTIYGGDGHTQFGLPDLRGRVPMHAGTGPALTSRRAGDKMGSERNLGQISEHKSLISNSKILSTPPNTCSIDATDDNMQPTLCINYIIAITGKFPRRN
ncbi:microcystin-dependent protein [Yoonia maritima]|uniref:Microcystin-dependent protein n=1 Tax=Yoonia maritima TaxID=1435347 RepID=A0A2T0VW30_9RHOB|nr:tail fiber protein [Yoonia maritima]PRY76020.1 microcystin-dependent protein [Yoonia maritima]